MSKTVALSLLNRANNGAQLLQILDSLIEDNAPAFDVIESPMIEQALGIPTLEPIAF